MERNGSLQETYRELSLLDQVQIDCWSGRDGHPSLPLLPTSSVFCFPEHFHAFMQEDCERIVVATMALVQSFLMATLLMLVWLILCCGSCLMFNSICVFYLVDGGNNPPPPFATIKNIPRYFQKSPLKAKYPLNEKFQSTPSPYIPIVSHLGIAAYHLPGIL